MSTPEPYAVSAQLAELGHTTIFDILEQSCSRYGDSPAFSCGADTLTFNQLRGRADAFARYLRQHAGLQPGDRLELTVSRAVMMGMRMAVSFSVRTEKIVSSLLTDSLDPLVSWRHFFCDDASSF